MRDLITRELAQGVVHSVFAGYRNFTIGSINKTLVLIPIDFINGLGPKKIDIESDFSYLSLLTTTGQPSFIN